MHSTCDVPGSIQTGDQAARERSPTPTWQEGHEDSSQSPHVYRPVTNTIRIIKYTFVIVPHHSFIELLKEINLDKSVTI